MAFPSSWRLTMNSVWLLPPSLRITLFIFMMISLAFLLFGIVFVTISKRNKYIASYLLSLFIVLLFMVIVRTPILYKLNDKLCDYLSLINIIPMVLAVFVFIKNKNPLLFIDMVYLLINITLFSFIPYYGYVVSILVLYILVRSIMIFFKSYKDSKTYPGSIAIKYALDELNVGVIFSNSFNQIIYINKSMLDVLSKLEISNYEKVNSIYKKLLSKASRLINNNDFIIALDDKSYRFTVDNNLKQITCFDMTIEENLLKEEENTKSILSKVNESLNEQLNKVDEIQKEKELLSVKGYIHDSLAQKLSILHMFLLNDNSKDLKEIKKMLRELDITTSIKYDDDLSYFINLLSDVGIKCSIKGEYPKDDNIKSLFIKAIKEASVNAIRHGKAKIINIEMDDDNLLISNDGIIPDNVNFGNGLTSINIEAHQLGYDMKIHTNDNFVIKLISNLHND